MEILLQSDGQLYPPKIKGEAPPKPPPPPPAPPSPPPPKEAAIPWEELLLVAVVLIVLKSEDRADIPLLLALAYILFDSKFSLSGLL